MKERLVLQKVKGHFEPQAHELQLESSQSYSGFQSQETPTKQINFENSVSSQLLVG